jgi:hypothetical protein
MPALQDGIDRPAPGGAGGRIRRDGGLKRFRELSNGSHLPAEQPALDELRREIARAGRGCRPAPSGGACDVTYGWRVRA